MMIALVIAAFALPLPPYTDDQAAGFVSRAEKLMADIEAGTVRPPRDFKAALAVVGVDPRRLPARYTHVGNFTFADEYRLSDGYTLLYSYLSPAGQFQGIVVRRRE